MFPNNSGWRNWGDHPIVVAIATLTAIIGIVIFITGKADLPSLVATAPTPLAERAIDIFPDTDTYTSSGLDESEICATGTICPTQIPRAKQRLLRVYAPLYIVAVIRFDISKIPSNAQIQKAVMHLIVESKTPDVAIRIRIHQINEPWEDYQAENTLCGSKEQITDYIYSNGKYSVDITPIVQYEYGNPDVNYGICIEGMPDNDAGFFFTSNEGNISLRPRLRVTYTMP